MVNMNVGNKYPGFNDPDGSTFPCQVKFAQGISAVPDGGDIWYVDGDLSASGDGKTWSTAFITIQEGVTAASAHDTVYVKAKTITDATGDPTSYAETIIIPLAASSMKLIGVSNGLTQGGLPQIKKGSGSTALLTVRAPGCLIANLGFNGSGSTGGGILLDDDNSTKSAFGTTILGCHFKNCKGHATNGSLGGAITWSAEGNAWQVYIAGNRFYKNVADIVLLGTSNSVPQDVVIENNIFSGPAASVDANLLLNGGSGMNGVYIRNNLFPCFPALGGGSNTTVMKLTGCVGTLSGNAFGCTGKTFGAAANVVVPTTVLMADNYQEDGTTQITRA